MSRIVCPPLNELDLLRQPLTKGERLVLEYFLDNLPISWEIYIQPHLNGLRPDFVLLHPKNGIAVYEVKDWNLNEMDYFVSRNSLGMPQMMASRNGCEFSVEKNNPVPKIHMYKDEIYSLYCPGLPSKSGFGTITAGVIFPFSDAQPVERLLEPFRSYYGHDKHKAIYPIVSNEMLKQTDIRTLKHVLRNIYQEDEDMSDLAAKDLRHWLVEPDFSSEQRRTLMNELSTAQKRFVLTRLRLAIDV